MTASFKDALTTEVRAFLGCLPQPIFYYPDASAQRLHQLVVPSLGVVVVSSDDREPMALASLELLAKRTRNGVVALSRHPAIAGSLRFDLLLRQGGRWTAFGDYEFRKAGGGGVFTPFKTGRLVRLDRNCLAWSDDLYVRTADGKVTAVDRAASERVRQLIDVN